ncbi:hypothetical protein H2200_008938 [Cladophialophora chaetospira]|uniref:Uncharacterized protein n=1 Tax=Cladophialophora chaetospira TaxID=386627 RepID=A0AA38X4Y5_9EURO|nr:hypothetical protein H2200_008938 [Cladophialophora chaetospira]
MSEIKSKGGAPIEKGDTVSTPILTATVPRRKARRRGEKLVVFVGSPVRDSGASLIPLFVLNQVEEIVASEDEAQKLENAKGAGHAPAVVFTDQNNKKVAHKPTTVTNLDKEG